MYFLCHQSLYKISGYIDIDKIDASAWPALAADLGAGDHSISALAFGRLLYSFPSFFGSLMITKSLFLKVLQDFSSQTNL
jgi:hypothetical protein